MNFLKSVSKIIIFIFCFTTLNAQVTVGPMVVGQGVSSPNDWQDYSNRGIYVDVNTSACGFTTTPHYLISIESITNAGYHWELSGAPAIYNPTPTGFRVYLQWTDHETEEPNVGIFPNPLRASTALNRGWVIRWTGITTGDCGACNNSSTFRDVDNSGIEASPSETAINASSLTEKEVKIFPNPSDGAITVSSSDNIVKCEVYDLNSQLLKTTTKKVIDIGNLPNGDYLVKVYFDDKKTVTKQFIKME